MQAELSGMQIPARMSPSTFKSAALFLSVCKLVSPRYVNGMRVLKSSVTWGRDTVVMCALKWRCYLARRLRRRFCGNGGNYVGPFYDCTHAYAA